ncbi:hypothetical protein HK104_003333 [Borealophlyctis nickersoniae]|nr:hypothetical protein HK104_003333 [Borealophlyctis nickersoniae]
MATPSSFTYLVQADGRPETANALVALKTTHPATFTRALALDETVGKNLWRVSAVRKAVDLLEELDGITLISSGAWLLTNRDSNPERLGCMVNSPSPWPFEAPLVQFQPGGILL